MSSEKIIYAIDFGTSNSLLGAASADKIHGLVPMEAGRDDPHVLRSLMYFAPQSPPKFGEAAIADYLDNSMHGRFLRSFKRFLPMKGFEGTLIDGKHWRLEDLVARFLREMRTRANAHFNADVDAVVMGHPALFSEDGDAHRLAHSRLEEAARAAGFRHIEFLAEPVAAAYRYRLEMQREEIVLVADFGGGTSDFTVLKLSQKAFQPEDVLAIGGVPLAGDALDGAVMSRQVAKHFGAEVSYQAPFSSNVLHMPKALMSYLNSTAHINFLNSRENREFLARVKSWSLGEKDQHVMDQLAVLVENQLGFSVFEAIERAKRDLAQKEKTEIAYSYPGIALKEKTDRKKFASLTQPDVDKIFAALDATLQRAGLRANQVDRVCCTGGTAKVLAVRQALTERFTESRLENFRNFTSIVEGLNERAQQLLRA